jgi:hypothetical protein
MESERRHGSGTRFFCRRTFGGWTLTQSDPTDHALATIASILDQTETPTPQREPEQAAEPPPLAPAQMEADGYSKVGPGPMAAIRFKWTVRRADDGYYVDETIGESSAPHIVGPMTAEAAIKLVDERESDARRRFEQLKSEMMGRAAAADLVRGNGGGEA